MAFFGDCTNSQNGGTTSATVNSTLPAGCLPGMIFVGGIGTNSGVATLNSLLGAATAGHDWSGAVILPAGALPKAGDSQAGNIETLLVVRVLTAQDIADGFVQATLSATGRCYFQASVHSGVSGFATPPAVAKATASTLTAPTLTTIGNGSDVVCVVGARNAALSTFPVVTVGTGFTSNATTGTANAASANLGGATGQLTAHVGVGVSVGGQTISATNTPTQFTAYLVELLANPPLPQPTRRRTPFIALRRRPAVVPPTPVVAAATLAIPQPRRRVQPFAFLRRRPAQIPPTPAAVTPALPLPAPRRRNTLLARITRRPSAVPPAAPMPLPTLRRRTLQPARVTRRPAVIPPTAVVVTPTAPLPSQRRRITPWTRQTRRPAVIPPTPVVAAPSLPLPAPRRRLVPFLRLTRRPAQIPPTVAAVAPSTLPTAAPRRRIVLLTRTRRAPQVIPPAAVQAPAPIIGQITRRRTIQPPPRRAKAQIVPPAIAAPLPQPARARRTPLLPRRTRGVQLPPVQVVTTAPLPPSQPRRRRWWTPWRPRRNVQFPFAGGTAPVIVTPFDGKVGHPRTAWGTGRPTTYLPPATQAVTVWAAGQPRVNDSTKTGQTDWTSSTLSLRSGPNAP